MNTTEFMLQSQQITNPVFGFARGIQSKQIYQNEESTHA